MSTLSVLLFAVAAVGLVLLGVEVAALRRHLRAPAPTPRARPGITILKPLCGVDDQLGENLAAFAALAYPALEILLGVESVDDPAYRVARYATTRWPDRFRIVVQRGAPGLNPKVNQLVGLAAAARHDILLVSDSNVRPPPGYLDEIAAHLEDPTVGLVTHGIIGGEEERLGSILDGLHLTCFITPGLVGAKRVAKQDLVVGKSMALRRADLAALGGFAAVKDVLAEDYVLGRWIGERLGKRVALGRLPVVQVSERRSVGEFVRRQLRWSVMRRKMVALPVYLAELALMPIPVAAAALAACPSRAAATVFLAMTTLKLAVDATAAHSLGARVARIPAVVLKDFLTAAVWAAALLSDTVSWRGRRLRVLRGTRLAALPRRALVTAPPRSRHDARLGFPIRGDRAQRGRSR